MPMDREAHEDLLKELAGEEISVSRRMEILQELRTDYTGVTTDFEERDNQIKELQADKEDLTLSNSKLFRKLGEQEDKVKGTEEIKQKNFSETVTVSELLKKAGV